MTDFKRHRSVSNLDLQKEQTARYFPSGALLAGLCQALGLSVRRFSSNLLGHTGRTWSRLTLCPDCVHILGIPQDLDPAEAQGWDIWDDESPPPLLTHPA